MSSVRVEKVSRWSCTIECADGGSQLVISSIDGDAKNVKVGILGHASVAYPIDSIRELFAKVLFELPERPASR